MLRVHGVQLNPKRWFLVLREASGDTVFETTAGLSVRGGISRHTCIDRKSLKAIYHFCDAASSKAASFMCCFLRKVNGNPHSKG